LVGASIVVFTELKCVPAGHLKAEDQIHRFGQNRYVDIYYLHPLGSIDDEIRTILEKKSQIINTII
jgi:SNF2 family DNA or RNA helicase